MPPNDCALHWCHSCFLFRRHKLTRHQYYLQLRKDILEDRLYCNEETGLYLAALALQAEFGDYMPEVERDKKTFTKYWNFKYLLCNRVSFCSFVCHFSCMVNITTSQNIMCPRGCWRNWLCPTSGKSCPEYTPTMCRCRLKTQKQNI